MPTGIDHPLRTDMETTRRPLDLAPYLSAGFKSRREYLDNLAEDYGREKVYALASILGPSEDFDGLVTSLEDDADLDDME
jgi:hypothetical protein